MKIKRVFLDLTGQANESTFVKAFRYYRTWGLRKTLSRILEKTRPRVGKALLWDDSAERYRVGDFAVYWMCLDTVQKYQLRVITGSEKMDQFTYALGYVRDHIGEKDLRALSIGCSEIAAPEIYVSKSGMFREIDVIDLAPGLLEKQRKTAKEHGVDNIRYLEQDLNEVVLPELHYDFIWALGTVHHLQQLEHFFSQVNKGLTTDGLFMMHEYVGPNFMQYTDGQLKIINDILEILPEKYRRRLGGEIKRSQDRTDKQALRRLDPSESVRSEDILRVAQDELDVVQLTRTGGTLLMPLLSTIAGNFEKDREGRAFLKLLIYFEEVLIAKELLPSDSVFCMAKKSALLRRSSGDPAVTDGTSWRLVGP